MKSIWVPLSGAIAQQRKIDTIANNVANANTPGFKKDDIVFREYLSAVEQGIQDIHIPRKEFAPKDFYHPMGSQNALVQVHGSYTNFQQGQLTPTGNYLDLGINGKGFFEILSPGGVRYTRVGNFTISKDGYLTTTDGSKILSSLPVDLSKPPQAGQEQQVPQPDTRTINLENAKGVTINLAGEIYSEGQKIGQLSIVEFNDIQALRKEGNSNYINSDNTNIKTGPAKSTIHQGFIEESNVNVMAEMTELIKANRNFESVQRVIKAYDSITGKSVNELTRF